jgi:hypothetical protein
MSDSHNIQSIQDFVAGMKKLDHADLNGMLDACRLGAAYSQMGGPQLAETWLAIIDATDKTDYTDERYWVKPARCTNNSGDNTALITGASISTDDSRYQQVTASNLAEIGVHTHTLPASTPVLVLIMYDIQNPAVKHYFFWQSIIIITFGKPTAAYTSGATLTLDPCDIAGTDNGCSNITLQAGWTLPDNTNISTSAIIPFARAANNNYYTVGQLREIITNVQYDTSSHKLQKKVRGDFGAFSTTESSSWVDVTTAVSCSL